MEKSSDEFYSIFEWNPLVMYLYEISSFKIIKVNKAFERLFGYDQIEAEGLSYLDLFPEKIRNEKENTLHYGEQADLLLKNGTMIQAFERVSKIEFQNKLCNLVVITDISDILLADLELEKKEMILNSIFQVIPDIFFLLDSEGTILSYKAQKLADLYLPPEKFLGKKITELLPGEINSLFALNLEKAAGEGHLQSFEYEMNILGQPQYFECRLSRVEKEEQFVAIIRNISEEYNAKKALISSESRFRNLLENAPFPLFVVLQKNLQIVFMNKRAQLQFSLNTDWTRSFFIQSLFFNPKDIENFINSIQSKKNVFDEEYLLKDLTGYTFWALLSVSPVEFENQPAVTIAVNDINDRKLSEINLKNEKIQLRTLINSIPDPVWFKDKKGRYLICNLTFEKLYGIQEKEILGKTDFEFMDSEKAKLNENRDETIMQLGVPVKEEEYIHFISDEYGKLFEIIKAPVHDNSGNLLGILGIARDITISREMQHSLNERVKEQKCLYSIFELTEDIQKNLEDQFFKVIEVIKLGWQYPEITQVQIIYGNTVHESRDFQETEWVMENELFTANGELLKVRILYKSKPSGHFFQKIFLPEEEVLLEAIARRLRDVIDRRNAAKSLREREQLMTIMFAQTTDSIAFIDIETGSFIEFNSAAHLGLGYSREEFSLQAITMDYQEFVMILRNVNNPKMAELEFPFRHKNGTIQEMSLTLRPISIAERPLISAVWRDITELKNRERDLKALASRLQSHSQILGQISSSEFATSGEVERFAYEITEFLSITLETEQVAIWLCNQDESEMYCMDQFEQSASIHSSGQKFPIVNKNEMNILKSARYIFIDNTDQIENHLSLVSDLKSKLAKSILICSIISGGKIRGFISFQHYQNYHEWGSEEITLGCQVADQIGMAILNKDRLDTSKELERYQFHLEELVKSRTAELSSINEEQTTIFEAATTGIALIRQRLIIRCNRKLEEIFGYQWNELIGKTTRILYPTEDSYLKTGELILENMIQNGYYEENEIQYLRKDGSLFWARIKARALNEKDLSKGFVAIIEDISAEREATEILKKAKEAAEEATRAKSYFLANMSHEIRTPMNAVIGLSHLALKTDLNPKQRDYLEKIHTSGQHLLGIINDILDFSKIEAGKLNVENINFELDTILDHISDFLSEKALSKGIELIFDISLEVPNNLIGDQLRIGQVLLNLASNAIKFTEKGEIYFKVFIEERTKDRIKLNFSVKDTGIGLTENQKNQLFKSFQQADMSTTRKYGGSGLGLVISKKLVELMGGEIGLESQYGQGSTFWFSVEVGVSPIQKDISPIKNHFLGLKALVVDDNLSSRKVLSEILKSLNFTVIEAESTEDANSGIDKSKEFPFDIIFLNWKMHTLHGIETTQKILGMNLFQLSNIVLISAYDKELLLKQTENREIKEIIKKPFTPSRVMESVLKVLFGEKFGNTNSNSKPKFQEERITSLKGAKILIVEDNKINQEVGAELLYALGINVEIAENGEIAIEKLQSGDYNLVLMDMQMPVMDGITATIEIRKNPKWQTLPIIAMTANAMQKDREDCIDAGMNDFITKPIEPEQLWTKLLEWISPNAIHDNQFIPKRKDQMTQEFPDSISGINMELGLHRVLGNKALYISLLKSFLKERKNSSIEIRNAIKERDYSLADRISHTVKGVSGNIGATNLYNHATLLNKAIRENFNEEEIYVLLENFEKSLQEIILDLETKLSSEEPEQIPMENNEEFQNVCQELLQLLKEDDAIASDYFEENLTVFSRYIPAEIEDLKNAIRNFDYEKGIEILNGIMNK